MQELGYKERRANALQRATWLFSSSRLGAWLFSKSLHHVDRALMRLTKGRVTMAGAVAGLPIITLVTTGAKSGKRRESPLVGVPIGDDLAVVGTSFGQTTTPSWWFNLRANPDVEVVYRDRSAKALAREADADEHAAVFARASTLYSGYEKYADRITDRPIHIAVLEQVERA